MQVTETLSQGLKREFKVVLPAQDLVARVDGQLADLKNKARINGFRPGKVPVSHLKRLYGRSIMIDVVQDAVNEANRKIVEENDLRLATQPKFDFTGDQEEIVKALEARSDFAFTVALEVLPKFEVGTFEGLEVERLVVDVSDEEVAEVLQRLADQNRTYADKEAADAVAEKGDKVVLDFVGKIGEEAFEGGSGTDIDLVLGSGSFIPGFEDQVAGMKKGDSKTISVTFPDNYASAKLAGQAATFDVTVKGIAAPGDVTLDDEFAKNFGMDDLGKLKDSLRGNIEKDYSAASRMRWKRSLLDALDKKYAFDLPEALVAQEYEQIWSRAEAERQQAGRSFEDEGTTEEAAKADYRKIAERRVRLGLVVAEIGEKADVKVSDEEVTQALIQRMRNFPGQEKAVWEFYRKNPDAMAEIRAPLYEEKVIDHIMGLAKVTDKKVTKDELMQAPIDPEDAAAGAG